MDDLCEPDAARSAGGEGCSESARKRTPFFKQRGPTAHVGRAAARADRGNPGGGARCGYLHRVAETAASPDSGSDCDELQERREGAVHGGQVEANREVGVRQITAEDEGCARSVPGAGFKARECQRAV